MNPNPVIIGGPNAKYNSLSKINNSQGGDPMIDMTLKVTTPPAQKKKNDISYVFPVTTSGPGNPPQFFNPSMAYPYFPQPTIRKNYNITIGGPEGGHSTVAAIIEDQLPVDQYTNFDSIEGRTGLTSYLRAQLLNGTDGEDIMFGQGSSSSKNLLSYLKLLKVNPYSENIYTRTPYAGLSKDILLYSSCYPIRLNDTNTTSICAKDSQGINIRIYKITKDEYEMKDKDADIYEKSNVWREMAYYEYVNKRIVEKKQCPHFVRMHMYYLTKDGGVDFDDLEKARTGKGKIAGPAKPVITTVSMPPGLAGPLGLALRSILYPGTYTVHGHRIIKHAPISVHSKEALIALTEAPNSSFIQWASSVYEDRQSRKVQVKSGVYNSRTWNSILFQISCAMLAMQKHLISFYEMTLEDNIYIRSIKKTGNVTSFWKYIINGAEYYVPNYGFMAMIDSKFKNVDVAGLIVTDISERQINAPFFDKLDEAKKIELKKKIFKDFKKMIDPSTFGTVFVKKGGTPPPSDVISKLHSLQSAFNDTDASIDIDDYLELFFAEFLNNRIGTYLKENEVELIREHDADTGDFKRGEMVINTTTTGKHMFMMFIKKDTSGNCDVLTKDSIDGPVIKKTIPISSLYHYSKYQKIEQEYKPNEMNLSEDDIIDTFVL